MTTTDFPPPAYSEKDENGSADQGAPLGFSAQYSQPPGLYPGTGQPITQQPYPGTYPAAPQYSIAPAGGAPYSQFAPGYNTQEGYVPQPQGTAQTVYINASQPLMNPPNDYFGLSVFSTLCCCMFIGIFAIMKTRECQVAARQGRREDAERHSKQALVINRVAITMGTALMLIYVTFVVVYYSFLVPMAYNRG